MVELTCWEDTKDRKFSTPRNDKLRRLIEYIISKVSDSINKIPTYYEEYVLYKSGVKCDMITKIESRENNDPAHSVLRIIGNVGIGKTSFIRWWRESSNRQMRVVRYDVSTYLRDLVPDNLLNTMARWIANDLYDRLVSNDGFQEKVKNEVETERRRQGITLSIDAFFEGFIHQQDAFLTRYPKMDCFALLAFLIRVANLFLNKPVFIFIDNIDMEKPELQRNYVHTSFQLYQIIFNQCNRRKWNPLFHIVVSFRPETFYHYGIHYQPATDTYYPTPNFIGILKKRINEELDNIILNDEPLENPYDGVIVLHTTKGIACYIKNRLNITFNLSETDFGKWPWPDYEANEWHNYLVDSNMRKFLNSFSGIIKSGNFIETYIFPDGWVKNDEKIGDQGAYKYLRTIIKGCYTYFPGNELIDGYGERDDSPLFFNLMGLKYSGLRTVEEYINNYLIYIRIMQYLCENDDDNGISWAQTRLELERFFPNILEQAVKKLLWVRLIIETKVGCRDIGPGKNFDDIVITDDCYLKSNGTTKLYLKNLICEYSYLSEMAMISNCIKKEDNNSKKQNDMKFKSQKVRHAQATYSFLRSLKDIIVCNLKDIKSGDLLKEFKLHFYDPPNHIGPWITAINSSINALQGFADSEDELHNIRQLIIELRDKGSLEICSILGVDEL